MATQRHSQAYFDRGLNSWIVGRWDRQRAGSPDAYSTYKDKATAERVAREENEEERRSADARKTITHNETVQALKDVTEYKRRWPGTPYQEVYFISQFNSLIDQVRGGWEWDVYRDAVKAAFADLPAPKRARAKR